MDDAARAECALLALARLGDADRIHDLVTKGVNVRRKDEDGMTALHRVAQCGHLADVKALIVVDHGLIAERTNGVG